MVILSIAAFATRQQRYRSDEKVIANTTYGQIKGVKWRSLYGPTYYSFEGIPFAKPPIGDLRFKAPQEPEPWTEIKSCTHIKSRPCQYNLVLNMVQGSEDCLYLNVYTKEVSFFVCCKLFWGIIKNKSYIAESINTYASSGMDLRWWFPNGGSVSSDV